MHAIAVQAQNRVGLHAVMQQKLHRIDWTELDWPEAARLQGRAAGQGLACARNSAVPAEGLRSEVTSRSSRAPSNSSVSESSRSSARHTARRCRRTTSRCGRRSSHCTPAAPPPCHRQQHVTSDRRISGPAPAEPQPLKCQQVPLLRKLSVVRQLQMPACDARMTLGGAPWERLWGEENGCGAAGLSAEKQRSGVALAGAAAPSLAAEIRAADCGWRATQERSAAPPRRLMPRTSCWRAPRPKCARS